MKGIVDKHTEKQLIDQLKRGSHLAFDSIYQMYAKRLYAYCFQFTKSHEEAEEMVQEVFIRLWTQRAAIRQEETLRSLLFIMARHQLINAFRSRLSHPEYESYLNYLDTLSAGESHCRMEYEEFVRRLHQALSSLPETQQQVIRLSRFEQLSHREIAQRLSLSEQTVKNQLSLGLKALKEKLDRYGWLVFLIFC